MRSIRIAAISVVLAGCLGVPYFTNVAFSGETHAQKIVIVKYRLTPVDVGHPCFESADTSRSSFVTGAWYDASNSYMIIGLNGVKLSLLPHADDRMDCVSNSRLTGTPL